jgi:HEAT repeat protein
VLAVLSTYPAEGVRPAILQAARSESQPVRLAAFKALEATGDASVVAFAAEAAAKSRGAEQAAARATLGALKGRAVDEAILSQLAAQPPEDVRGELLLAVADRRIFSAKAPIAAAIASSSPRLRVQGLKALRVIGTPSDVPAVLDLVVNTGDDVERAEAEATVVALAQKTLKANAKASMLKTRYADEKAPQSRGRLLALFPQVGDDSALPILRTALADENADVRDAAVRALTAWPTTAARDDVFRLARDSRNETHRLLAIGALVRLVGVDRHRDPQAAVADLRAAAAFSWRPEEHRLVLGALEQFACADALDLAKSYASEAPVKAEAEAAVTKISERLKEKK